MKRIYGITFLFVFYLFFPVISQQDIHILMLQARYTEEVEGNLEKAVKLYIEIVKKYSDNREICAEALLKEGYCFEKMGKEKAWEIYKLLVHNYSDQAAVVAAAQIRLAERETRTAAISPGAKYYYNITGIDPMTAMSFDGKYTAYTDWSTGNLVIKNNSTGDLNTLTRADFSRFPAYAVEPKWSHDNKKIAYTWHWGPYKYDLRTVTLKDHEVERIYHHEDQIVYAADWMPDGESIIGIVYDMNNDYAKNLVMFSVRDGSCTRLTTLSKNSRGLRSSPDGCFIAFDRFKIDPKGENRNSRHIFIYSLANREETQISSGFYGSFGFDNPIWSKDGSALIFRSRRSGVFDLWSMKIHDGLSTGESVMVQSNMNERLLDWKGVTMRSYMKTKGGESEDLPHEFIEEFDSAYLDSKWMISEWNGPNVYEYKSFGRYSLISNKGNLRFYLDPGMHWRFETIDLAAWSQWQWFYPALDISRGFEGKKWTLECKVTYHMLDGANQREFDLVIFFGSMLGNSPRLMLTRHKDIRKSENRANVLLFDKNKKLLYKESFLASSDTTGVTSRTYYFKIHRDGSVLSAEVSYDGLSYRDVLSANFPDITNCDKQILTITGRSWFVPAGAYADWDYIRVVQQ